jgi:DNA (cytosine-5)-methyltransferase 1
VTFDKKVKFIDLFAGIGGFHHAALKVFPDAECVMAVEWDKSCQKVYSAAFPDTDLRGDIREVLTITKDGQIQEASADEIRAHNLVPEHDILFAGFPCQPFSKGGAQEGMSDTTRGTLFHEIIRIVEARRPAIVLLENVSNLVSHDDGRTWSTIIQTLLSHRYSVDPRPLIISPHKITEASGGTPQSRPRVYIIAVNTDFGLQAPRNDSLLSADDLLSRTAGHNLVDFLGPTLESASPISEVEALWLNAWDEFLSRIPASDIPSFPIWVDTWYGKMKPPKQIANSGATIRSGLHSGKLASWTGENQIGSSARSEQPYRPQWWLDIQEKNLGFYAKYSDELDTWYSRWSVATFPDTRRKMEWQAKSIRRNTPNHTLRDCLIQLRPSGIRVRPTTYAPALIAMNQAPVIGLPSGWKKFGPTQAAKLQGFPVEHFNEQPQSGAAAIRPAIYLKQLGNAVHVGIAALILRRALEQRGDGNVVADQLQWQANL